ncbi:hypothetical protein ABIB15_002134 [Marisediminicola sp. UYEF4]|uniref:hypothetical protein n=1 Tax=Marisediminicola sp. UYEF4 TaxID=1756384 RepID=UPI003399B9A1
MSGAASGWDELGYEPSSSVPEFPHAVDGPSAKAAIELPAAERTKTGPSQATVLVQLAHSLYRIIHGDEGRFYAVERGRPSIAMELNKDRFGSRLAADYFAAKTQAASGSALNDAMAVLRGQVLNDAVTPVYLRMARHEGRVVLDLGTDDCRALVVSPSGWQVVEQSPVLFRRNGLGLPFPTPAKGGSVDGLHALLNVDDRRFRLLVGWLISTFLPDIPQAILVITGQQGTAKTTTAKMLLNMFDPNAAGVQSQPTNEENWAVSARAVYGVGLDNVSRMPPWFQDAVCKATTGAAFVRRARYSDDSPSTINLKRPIVITTINPGALQGDVADRMLKVELDPVDEAHRREAAEVDEAFNAAWPQTFGALLDLVALVLAAHPGVVLARKSRMADFMRVLAALDQVTGWDTLHSYRAAIEAVSQDVIDGDSFATSLVALVEQVGVWTGTCGELLARLEDGKQHTDWPKTPRGAAEKLTRLSPALAKAGVLVARHERSNRGTQYSITRAGVILCAICQTPIAAALVTAGESTHPTCQDEEAF